LSNEGGGPSRAPGIGFIIEPPANRMDGPYDTKLDFPTSYMKLLVGRQKTCKWASGVKRPDGPEGGYG
jgi:hypothetical protein